jgi:hypothetical protein
VAWEAKRRLKLAKVEKVEFVEKVEVLAKVDGLASPISLCLLQPPV